MYVKTVPLTACLSIPQKQTTIRTYLHNSLHTLYGMYMLPYRYGFQCIIHCVYYNTRNLAWKGVSVALQTGACIALPDTRLNRVYILGDVFQERNVT